MRQVTDRAPFGGARRLACALALVAGTLGAPTLAIATDVDVPAAAFEEVRAASVQEVSISAQASSTVAARELLDLVNDVRVDEGEEELGWDSALEQTAKVRAKEIAEVFEHVRPDGSSCFTAFPDMDEGYRAENIAKGHIDAVSVNADWTASSGHHRNMVNSNMRSFAAACYTDDAGMTYWVECFSSAKPDDEGTSQASWTRLAGDNRYQTMKKIVNAGFTEAEHAVVASGATFPDALCAAAVAGAHSCPVILTQKDVLTAEAASELERLGVSSVTIMGGENTVSYEVEYELESMGITTTRVSGEDRASTSVAALRAARRAGADSSTLIVASGSSFADTLTVGPYAYRTASPIVLTAGGILTDAAVEQILSDETVERVVLLGGAVSVSDYVMEQLGDGYSYVRLGGADRYETSEQIASWEADEGLSFRLSAVADGRNFPDALAASALVGKRQGILVLAHSPSDKTVALLQDSSVSRGYILGGESSVASDIANALA